jgi:cytochrome c biogenesis protein CcmG, thiol:disulfide interchange protein DsbE
MKSLLISLIIILVFVTASAQSDNNFNSGRTAPNFKLENIDREIIELNDFLATGPVLLCFWSSCCKSAVSQLEAFAELYDNYSGQGFTMLGIATDDENTIAKVKPHVKSKKYKFQVLYDSDQEVARIYYAFDVPFSVLIDASGKIVYSHLGYMKGDEIVLENNLKLLLVE